MLFIYFVNLTRKKTAKE